MARYGLCIICISSSWNSSQSEGRRSMMCFQERICLANIENLVVIYFSFWVIDKTLIDCDSDNWDVDELGFIDLFNQLLLTMPFNFNSLMDCD
ncbi:phosphatase, putative [Medicago truncatula]|uniref:Phosphatase, putative n=1 Tax=Medicago truncatula TaxID=3880 RepID=G7JXY7_MEDTR|nr:phosphatase, putative [Medicago truncatula]